VEWLQSEQHVGSKTGAGGHVPHLCSAQAHVSRGVYERSDAYQQSSAFLAIEFWILVCMYVCLYVDFACRLYPFGIDNSARLLGDLEASSVSML
jgi:hypothetical protein